MDAINHSFSKKHRLSSHTLIERLFGGGCSFFAYPLRCVWMITEPAPGKEMADVQILVSVSKKNHKRAVARNKLKRRIREAYRLNRHHWGELALPENKRLVLAFIYSSKEILEYSTIEHGVVKAISEIQKRLAAGIDLSVCPAD